MGFYSLFSDPQRKKRKLEEIDVTEISLVDSPANRTQFAIVKADAGLAQALTDFLEGFDIGKDEAEAAAAVTKALELLAKYKQDFPDDVMKAIKTLAAFAGSGYGYPEKKSEVKKGSGFPLWPSFTIRSGALLPVEKDDGDDGDDTEPPRQRGLRKSLLGQMSTDEPDDRLWPSLS